MPILPSKMECYISPSPPSIFVSVYAPMKCLKITHKPTQLIKLHMYIYIHTQIPLVYLNMGQNGVMELDCGPAMPCAGPGPAHLK